MSLKTAYLANGCFWCTEAVFQKIKGVEEVTSGFTGGHIKNPAYREVVEGRTGHAEAIRIVFDDAIVSFKDLLYIFFYTHDPTTLNRQGYDVGTQYRSAIFYTDEEQLATSNEVINELTNLRVFDKPIVTELTPASEFYVAEQEHQNFYNLNKEYRYCQLVIDPKLNILHKKFKQHLN